MLSEFLIENNQLQVRIKRKGAELCSVVDKSTKEEFIWQAGEVWPRHAPNLFPIVGSLLDHEYFYQGEKYSLTHHGFARDMDFDILHQSEHSISLVLTQSDTIVNHYPFLFSLIISYRLEGNSLVQTFRVINEDSKSIPASFGGHPAFNASPIEDYYIEFGQAENVKSNRLNGPFINEQELDIIDGNTIALNKDIFNEDALIFQGLKSEELVLKHRNSNRQISVDIKAWPYLGIWAKPGAPYVCIEPWQGLADFVGHDKNIENKKGIVWLDEGAEVDKSFSMKFISD